MLTVRAYFIDAHVLNSHIFDQHIEIQLQLQKICLNCSFIFLLSLLN